jgi:hypothetical protein
MAHRIALAQPPPRPETALERRLRIYAENHGHEVLLELQERAQTGWPDAWRVFVWDESRRHWGTRVEGCDDPEFEPFSETYARVLRLAKADDWWGRFFCHFDVVDDCCYPEALGLAVVAAMNPG